MIRETYKGRKILVTKGKEWGYAQVKVNGVSVSTLLGTQESALSNIRANIDYIGDEIDGARWGAEWYAPGTFELCANDHPQAIGGTCTHPYCKAETSPQEDTMEDSPTVEVTETDDTGHVDVKCTDRECYGCQFCAGGLWACSVCGGLEGSMPSTCPGQSMDEATVDAVYAGLRDFRDGVWVEHTVSRFAPFSAQQKASKS